MTWLTVWNCVTPLICPSIWTYPSLLRTSFPLAALSSLPVKLPFTKASSTCVRSRHPPFFSVILFNCAVPSFGCSLPPASNRISLTPVVTTPRTAQFFTVITVLSFPLISERVISSYPFWSPKKSKDAKDVFSAETVPRIFASASSSNFALPV